MLACEYRIGELRSGHDSLDRPKVPCAPRPQQSTRCTQWQQSPRRAESETEVSIQVGGTDEFRLHQMARHRPNQ